MRNTGEAPALFVKLDTDCEDTRAVYIEDNYFTLLAGEERDVYVFIPEKDKAKEIRAMKVNARAWNSKSFTLPIRFTAD